MRSKEGNQCGETGQKDERQGQKSQLDSGRDDITCGKVRIQQSYLVSVLLTDLRDLKFLVLPTVSAFATEWQSA